MFDRRTSYNSKTPYSRVPKHCHVTTRHGCDYLHGVWTVLLLTMISMVPLAILVVICKAWKKDVFSGPIPVFCGGIFTSMGEMAPALAGAATWRQKMACEFKW